MFKKKSFYLNFFLLVIMICACSTSPNHNIEAIHPTASQNQKAGTIPTVEATPNASGEIVAQIYDYPIVDSGQSKCYNNNVEITCSEISYYGQDAQYTGSIPSYTDNGDGTISDNITGLMWQADPGDKMTYDQATAGAEHFSLAGYDDWRLPTIKELYSLILFDGTDVSICNNGLCDAIPFIDTRYFNFSYGDESAGERVIDSQFASSTKYVSTTMNGMETMFGVNFADGRIKGYPTNKLFYVLYVRSNQAYGHNSFEDNSDGTISDNATGLTWMQSDSESAMNWEDALSYCENLPLAGADDWRLPNVKELQSLVDYSRSPDTSNSAAIDPLFVVSTITNEAEQLDYPFYWSSTTHTDPNGNGSNGAYVAFGRALGNMNGRWMDVHGAGAQRSDPKNGAASDFPEGHGPQGDAIRIENYVRCVRGGEMVFTPDSSPEATRPSMQIESTTGAGGMQGNQGEVPQPSQSPPAGLPPQEAIEACAGLETGKICSFDDQNGSHTGICEALENQLVCKPNR